MDNLDIQLRLTEGVIEQLFALSREKQKIVMSFVRKYRSNPTLYGTNYEVIRGARNENFHSVRMDGGYRGVLLKPESGNIYFLVYVGNHEACYRWARRSRIAQDPLDDQLIVPDVLEESPGIALICDETSQLTPQEKVSLPAAGFVGRLADEALGSLGVPEEYRSIIRCLQDETELSGLRNALPPRVFDAVEFFLHGFTIDDIRRELLAGTTEGVTTSTASGADAVVRSRFYVIDSDESLEMLETMLEAPLEKWRIFLHPSQRRIAEAEYSGPARVTGGAGTGKTVVAMHRAQNLASRYENTNKKILFTTFSRNLAVDIQSNLKKICTPKQLAHIEVVNLDAWIFRFLESRGSRVSLLTYQEELKLWSSIQKNHPDLFAYNTVFLHEEWSLVVAANDLQSAKEYAMISRTGRGRSLDRFARVALWPLFDEFWRIMEARKAFSQDGAVLLVRRLIGFGSDPLYESILVDEAQDFGEGSLRLLRSMSGTMHSNCLFFAGDSHQRIYRSRTSLGRCGIELRGRSSVLRINYRTTEETRVLAASILHGISFDDLDEGDADEKGYHSPVHGPAPDLQGFENEAEETRYLAEKVKELVANGTPSENLCLVARTQHQLDRYRDTLGQSGIRTFEIKNEKVEDQNLPGLRLATMHRVKGLEFDYLLIAGLIDGMVPLEKALREADSDIRRSELEVMERSLLHVAITRARKQAILTWGGKKSLLLGEK